MERERLDLLFLKDRPDELRPLVRPVGLAPSTLERSSDSLRKEYTTLRTSNPVASPTLSNVSTVSSSSTYSHFDSVSRQSSASTAPSPHILPPWHVHSNRNRSQALAMTRIDFDYSLQCEFAMVGCEVRFSPEDFEAWISHGTSHFGNAGPPPRTCCIFCDTASFENAQDPVSNWEARMIHIGGHYQNHYRHENARPDFFLIQYMNENGLLSPEDYAWAMSYTERKPCDNLVDCDFKTPEMEARECQVHLDKHDLWKEYRQMRRDKGNGRRERTHKSSHGPRLYQKLRS